MRQESRAPLITSQRPLVRTDWYTLIDIHRLVILTAPDAGRQHVSEREPFSGQQALEGNKSFQSPGSLTHAPVSDCRLFVSSSNRTFVPQMTGLRGGPSMVHDPESRI